MKGWSMSSGRVAWVVTTAALVATTVAALAGSLGTGTWERPQLLFAMVAGSAAACVLGATVVVALADRRELAEFGLLGAALLAASVMPLVHGLVTPGVLYDDTAAFRTSAFLSLPVAVAVASPLLLANSTFGRLMARRWRDWTLVSLTALFVLASTVVFFPDAIQVPSADSPLALITSVALALAVALISLRQLRYFDLGRRPANLVAALSLLGLAVTALLPLAELDYGVASWWLHAAAPLSVLGACVGLAVSKRMSRSARDLFEPVLTRDPLVAFELGLSPVVHRFVASLEAKDEITRDHVVRTAELAVRVGERFGLSGRDLRDLGLAALLHDVGKLVIPDAILNKPGRLTAEEYEVVKQHPIDSERMVRAERTLVAVAPVVRSHHERMDGRGYPDGLMGRDIPLASRIISVCDAFDAMTHDKAYRSAMPVKMAIAVLNEHAGSQWDPAVIEQLVTVLPSMPSVSALAAVGRDRDDEHDDGATMPANVEALLVAVDAET